MKELNEDMPTYSESLVSVCIPAYNNERYLQEAIESVICQNYIHFEVLIIDDCSTDNTAEIARKFALQDPRIRFLTNKVNLGMVPNWNRCLELAQGIYVKFLFGDDLLTSPDTLGRMVEILDRDREVSLVASARTIIDEESRLLDTIVAFQDNVRIPGKELINHCLDGLIQQHNCIGEPSVVMFRKSAAGRGFNPLYGQLVDIEMWIHLLEQGTFAYIEEALCAFRIHGDQQTVKNRQNLCYIKDMFSLLDDYLERPYTGVGPIAKRRAIFRLSYSIWKELRGQKVSIRKINSLIPLKPLIPIWLLYRMYVPFRCLSRFISKRWRSWEAAR